MTTATEQTATAAVVVPSEKKNALATRAGRYLTGAQAFRVEGPEDYEMVAKTLLPGIVEAKREVASIFDPVCAAANNAWKAATGARGEVLKPLEAAEALLKGKAMAWQRAEEQARAAETARLYRLQQQEHVAALAAEAKQLEESGATPAEVEAVIEQAPPPPAVYVAPSVPQVANVSTRQNWKAEVTNAKEFAMHQAQLPDAGLLAHPTVIEAINKVLTQQAKALKGTLRISGVRVWDDGTMAVRSR